MRRVAIDAADLTAGVGGFRKMRLRVSFAVATQAAGAGLLPRLPLEHVYFGFVAAARHVVGAGTVTTLTTLLRGTTRLIQCGLPVRRFLPCVVNFLVTSLASLSSHVLREFRSRRASRRCTGGLSALIGNRLASLEWSRGGDGEEQREEQKNSRGPGTSWHSHQHALPQYLPFV